MGDSFDNLKVPFLHHRGEAFRLVSREMQVMQKTMENAEYTVSTITILGALEGTLHDQVGFDLKLLEVHLKGMQQFLSLCPRRIVVDSPFQSMIRM